MQTVVSRDLSHALHLRLRTKRLCLTQSHSLFSPASVQLNHRGAPVAREAREEQVNGVTAWPPRPTPSIGALLAPETHRQTNWFLSHTRVGEVRVGTCGNNSCFFHQSTHLCWTASYPHWLINSYLSTELSHLCGLVKTLLSRPRWKGAIQSRVSAGAKTH